MKTLKNKIKNMKGITLISLVITIIVLLILAGISIQQLGENGLFGKVKRSKEESIKAQAVEDIQLKITEAQIAGNGDFTWKNFLKALQDAQDTYLVTTTSSQTASLSSENSGITTLDGLDDYNGSVYVTNLSNYNYEVEIGSDFRIKNQVLSTSTGSSAVSVGIENNVSNESILIQSISFETKKVTVNTIELTISVNPQSISNVAGYYVFLNNKIVRVDESNEIKINNLTKNSEYKIKCVALDIDGNIKISEQETVNTLNFSVEDAIPLEYPKLTADGFKNCKDTSGNLYYFEGITNSGDHAASYQAFDGLYEEFYVDDHMIFDIDESFRGKTINLIGYKNLSYVHAYDFSLNKTGLGYVWDKTIIIPENTCRIELETQSGRKGYIQEVEFE